MSAPAAARKAPQRKARPATTGAATGDPGGGGAPVDKYWSRAASWAALTALLVLFALSTWFAATQPPHPDLFRPIGNWDVARADWWRYPLERNAFKRTVIAGNLNSVFVLPDTQRVWAVGDGGLILHSADGGSTWRQQRPGPVAAPPPRGLAAALAPVSTAHAGEAPAAPPPPANARAAARYASPDGYDPKAQAAPAAEAKGVAAPPGAQSPADTQSAAPEPTPTPPSGKGASAALVPAQQPAAAPAAPVDFTTTSLSSVVFVDAERGWAVGERGTVLATADGGATWVAQTSGTGSWLTSVRFGADGQHGWAVDIGGTVLATTDGGATWVAQTSGTRSWLTSVSFGADGQRGWAVGNGGTVLATTDGGAHWESIATPSSGLPPWYFVALLVTTLGGVQVARRGRFSGADPDGASAAAPSAEVAVRLLADTPVEDMARDRLNYRPTVEALSGFIRNADTQPHLTLAITGAWGQGKSSIMRMLKTDLDRANFRTAWFNAWHHQQEGRPLSALFNVIRKQATPKLFSRQPLSALRVRGRLLWGRGPLYRGLVLLMLFGGLVAGRDFAQQHTYYGAPLSGWERLRWAAEHHLLGAQRLVLTPESVARLAPNATATAPPAKDGATAPGQYLVRQKVIDYVRGALVAGTAGDNGDTQCTDNRQVADTLRCVFDRPEDLYETVKAQTGVTLSIDERRHLQAVAVAIPPPPLFPLLTRVLLPLVPLLGLLLTKGVSVYGLQLLRPVSGLLGRVAGQDGDKEATGLIEHYRTEFALLTGALEGRLVLFIDDLDRCDKQTVNSMLELTNYLTDIGECFIVLGVAIEHIERSITPADAGGGLAPLEYAHLYLRKLIHIEVPVPHRAARTEGLFDPEPAVAAPGALAQLARRLPLAGLLSAALILGLLALSFPLFDALKKIGIGADQKIEFAAPAAGPASVAITAPTPPSVVVGNTPEPPSVSSGAQLTTAAREPRWVLLVIPFLVVAAALASRRRAAVMAALNRALGGASRTFDSADFVTAMKLWHPALVLHDPTPRGVKRFANRARLMAIYEQQSARADTPPRAMTPEVQVVALTAIHQVHPQVLLRWLDALGQGATTPVDRALQDAPSGLANAAQAAAQNTNPPPPIAPGLVEQLTACFAEHMRLFGAPTAADIARITRRIQDLKVR